MQVLSGCYMVRLHEEHTFENQLVFHRPAVPHGHLLVPPESKHEGFVKSLSNHQSTALDMEANRDGLLTYWSAPGSPPCQADVIVTEWVHLLSTSFLTEIC